MPADYPNRHPLTAPMPTPTPGNKLRVGACVRAALVLSLLLLMPVAGQITVTNVAVAQRPGTKLVDITYDVASTPPGTVSVTLVVTSGAAAVPATSVTGAVGGGVATGAGKAIVWNAGADWNGNVASLNYTLTADGLPPCPQFSPIVTASSGVTERMAK